MDEVLEVAYAAARSRVEIRRGGVSIGFVEYGLRADAAVLAYSEVDEAHAVPLLDGALAMLRDRGYRIVPLCPRVRAFLHAHPERQAGVDTRFLDPAHARRVGAVGAVA
ncbi:GNAT family N-acetyltransferase [Actinomycetospora cinnamomea]|uniref:N-acetyltransferase domain-containing protein n=1 Tax=Actinomycetospora cinnamomea TaxID=663609 RepID=A0A2U1FIH2_9PSEU|nr:N-acetyltransferase [Actinomycetospora cinnamomea]PVZ11982.1 hypothetical protein C8D89_103313 [Actinomycetospora cinnamomea]